MPYLSPALTLLVSAVKKAGQSLTHDFNEVEKLQASVRGSEDFAKAAVSRAERILRQELSKARPSYPFAVDGQAEPQGPHFVISAMDGLTNFAHGVPYFAISAAVVDNSIPLMAAIFNPATDELFFAEKGCGAFKEGFRNHERLRVSARKDMATALVSINQGHEELSAYQQLFAALLHSNAGVRTAGALSLDLAYAAAGKFDGVIGMHSPLSSLMAGVLLVKEAGGLIRDLHAKDIRSENLGEVFASGNIMAVNPNLSMTLYGVINK